MEEFVTFNAIHVSLEKKPQQKISLRLDIDGLEDICDDVVKFSCRFACFYT